MKLNEAYISLGTNIGDRKANLKDALSMISERIGKIINFSSVYETEPWGHHSQPDFYNQVVQIETVLGPTELLAGLMCIEETMGRVRTFKNASRLIDLDILFYDDIILEENGVQIPHPQIANRRFVLVPLNEIAPDLVDPQSKKDVSALLANCSDPLHVTIAR